jgi:hypothetical protein
MAQGNVALGSRAERGVIVAADARLRTVINVPATIVRLLRHNDSGPWATSEVDKRGL